MNIQLKHCPATDRFPSRWRYSDDDGRNWYGLPSSIKHEATARKWAERRAAAYAKAVTQRAEMRKAWRA